MLKDAEILYLILEHVYKYFAEDPKDTLVPYRQAAAEETMHGLLFENHTPTQLFVDAIGIAETMSFAGRDLHGEFLKKMAHYADHPLVVRVRDSIKLEGERHLDSLTRGTFINYIRFVTPE